MPGGLCFGGLPFGLEALTLQILGLLLFPADQACIVRHLDAAGEGPVQAVPARHPVFLEHAPACLAALALTDGTLGQRVPAAAPFFSQTSSGCRAVPQTGQAIVPMTGSSFHIDCSR